jgi:hypothetical protein
MVPPANPSPRGANDKRAFTRENPKPSLYDRKFEGALNNSGTYEKYEIKEEGHQNYTSPDQMGYFAQHTGNNFYSTRSANNLSTNNNKLPNHLLPGLQTSGFNSAGINPNIPAASYMNPMAYQSPMMPQSGMFDMANPMVMFIINFYESHMNNMKSLLLQKTNENEVFRIIYIYIAVFLIIFNKTIGI